MAMTAGGMSGQNLMVVRVSYCPHNESVAKAYGHARIRVGERTTFSDLRLTAAQFFTVDPHQVVLVDGLRAQWPLTHTVWHETGGRSVIIRMVDIDGDLMAGRGDAGAEAEVGGEGAEQGGGGRYAELLEMLGDGGEPAAAPEEEEAEDAGSEVSSAWSGDLAHEGGVRKSRVAVAFEVTVHLLFFLVLLVVSFSRRDVLLSNKMVAAFRDAFVLPEFGAYGEKSFYKVNAPADLWEWMEGPLSHGLFESDLDGSGSIMMYNRLVGSVRLRQLRVANNSCALPPSVYNGSRRPVPACFAPYSAESRDEAPFGPGAAVPGFTFGDAAEIFARPSSAPLITGRSASYDASGYVRDVTPYQGVLRRDEWAAALVELKANQWIDEGTRAVIVSLLAYNANFDLLLGVNFLFERSAGGQVYPLAYFRTMPTSHFWGDLASWDSASQRPYLWMDAPLALYLACSILLEVSLFTAAWAAKGSFFGAARKYFGGWVLLQWLLLLALAGGFAFRALLWFDPFFRDGYTNPGDGYLELGPVMEKWAAMCICDASALLFSCPKFIKFFLYTDSPLRLLSLSLGRAVHTFAWSIVLVFTFLGAMFVIGQQLFGFDLPQFATLGGALFTLMLMMVGDVDPTYYDMIMVDKWLAFFYFCVFVVLFLFVLTALFLAIISDSFAVTVSAMEFAEEERIEREKRAEARAAEKGKRKQD